MVAEPTSARGMPLQWRAYQGKAKCPIPYTASAQAKGSKDCPQIDREETDGESPRARHLTKPEPFSPSPSLQKNWLPVGPHQVLPDMNPEGPDVPHTHPFPKHLHTAVHHEPTEDSLHHCRFPPGLHEEAGLSQHPTVHPPFAGQGRARSIQQWQQWWP